MKKFTVALGEVDSKAPEKCCATCDVWGFRAYYKKDGNPKAIFCRIIEQDLVKDEMQKMVCEFWEPPTDDEGRKLYFEIMRKKLKH